MTHLLHFRLSQWPRSKAAVLAAAACLLWLPPTASAQEPPRPLLPTGRPAIVDTVAPLVEPLPAFLRSLILPGWGQAVLERKLTAGLFLLWEGVTLGMTVKTNAEVRFLRATESTRLLTGSVAESAQLRAKKAERQDWLVLLAFNHLFSGLEAYVSAHLWDFPGDLKIQSLPGERGPRRGIGLTLPLGRP